MGSLIASVVLAATFSQDQPKYLEYGHHTDRGGTRVAYWDNEKDQAAGQVAIEFGRPAWKPEYDGQLDAMTSGKIWRLGENFWTSLDTNIPLTLGGVDVPVGYYYLVVKRTEDGRVLCRRHGQLSSHARTLAEGLLQQHGHCRQ